MGFKVSRTSNARGGIRGTQGRNRLAHEVLSNDQQRLAGLGDLLEEWQGFSSAQRLWISQD